MLDTGDRFVHSNYVSEELFSWLGSNCTSNYRTKKGLIVSQNFRCGSYIA